MRNMKFLATTLVAVMLACVLALASLAATTPFKDVDDKNEDLSEAVSLLSGLGVAKGTSEDTFGTMELVTRQQMAAFVYRLMKKGESFEGYGNTTPFTDLDDSTYFGYISWANGTGVIKGTSPTTFNPKGGITLQDAYTMLVRALKYDDSEYEYPYTYIDTAEKIGLDEDVDSVVGYTTKLTRGDVAILLRNAFFAEMSGVETRYFKKDVNGTTYHLVQDDYSPSVAEKIYNVEVGTFTVRATPKFAFNNSASSNEYIPLCDDFDVDVLQLVATETDEPLQELYCSFDKTGLAGAADDYIMRDVKMYYTYAEDGDSNKLDKIYFVASELKTLETTKAEVTYVKAKEANDYFYNESLKKYDTDYPKCEGYLKVDNEVIFFYGAPYSYIEPDYEPGMTADEKQVLNDAKSAKIIDIKQLDASKGTYSYYIDEENQSTANAADLIDTLERVFANGIYKLKFFDVEGDGIYEYAQYMPATYGFMDGDTNRFFSSEMTGNAPIYKSVSKVSSIDVTFKPTIYYNEADITGVEFKDGDMVVAYLNPAANIIDVMAVVNPYRGYVSRVTSGASVSVDNQRFSPYNSFKVVENFRDGGGYQSSYDGAPPYRRPKAGGTSVFKYFIPLISGGIATGSTGISSIIGEVFDFYVIKNNGNSILWYDHIEDATIAFEMDELAVPSSEVTYTGNVFVPYTSEDITTKAKFDPKYEDQVYYAQTYLNGTVSYLPVNFADMYPRITSYEDNVYKITAPDTTANGVEAYKDKICKVVVDSYGHYAFIPLLHALDEDGNYVGINRDSATLVERGNNDLYGMDIQGHIGRIKKIAGSRYQLLDVNGDTMLGDSYGLNTNDCRIASFDLIDISRIIIKNINSTTGDAEYLEFDSETFGGSVATNLYNIQYILKGNPDSQTRADLVLLYAEAVDFEFDTKSIKNGWRVICDFDIAKDDEGNYRYFYKLFNPYTGEYEEDVPGEEYATKATTLPSKVPVDVGDIVEIKAGKVNEDGQTLGSVGIDLTDLAPQGLVYITEYNVYENYIGFVPVEDVYEEEADTGVKFTEETFVDFVESYTYDYDAKSIDDDIFKLTVDAAAGNSAPLYYEVTEDTVVTVLTTENADNESVSDGEFKLATLDILENPSKEYRCYNISVLGKNNNYTTKYAKYPKAYVYSSKDAYAEETLPEAEFIIIVVHGDEDMVFSNHDANFRNED